MVDEDDWDAEKMLNLRLHDYLLKKNMHKTAELFRHEAGISHHSVVIDGTLQDWWSLFYDTFSSRQTKLQEYHGEETSAKAEKVEDQSQNVGPTFSPQLMINQQMAPQVPIPRYSDSSFPLLETNQLRLPNSFAASSSLPQQQINLAPHQVMKEQHQGINLANTLPINSTTSYGPQKGKLPATLPHAAGLNEPINPALLNGWPLDAPNYQQQFQILNCQPEKSNKGLPLMPRNPTPTFPRSSAKFNYHNQMLPKQGIIENNRPDCIKAEEHKPVDDSVDPFLSHDDDNVENTSTPFKILRHRSNRPNKTEHKGKPQFY
ncbi:hypothetical protein V6N13_119990 [Hibiscus sabdariffa]